SDNAARLRRVTHTGQGPSMAVPSQLRGAQLRGGRLSGALPPMTEV
ncbi:MAG: hypothetical protein QOG78_1071, partial [Rhodospirillaceae bacterium]|nr:hypothetical protein [Rhodospirillaceae bacterium]